MSVLKIRSIRAQKGATSLLIVVGLAMALIVIIGGLTALSIRESRQALDTDLSNRALAAATAAAQDGAQRLNDNPDIQVPNCSGNADVAGSLTASQIEDIQKPKLPNTDSSVAVVCRTITSSAKTLQQQINQDQSSEFFTYIGNGGGVNKMRLLWGNGSAENSLYSGTVFPTNLNSNVPAVMELTLVYWPRAGADGVVGNGSVGSSGFSTKTILIMPSSNNTDPSLVNSYDPAVACSGYTDDLNSNKTYSCEAKVDFDQLIPGGAASQNVVVKLRSRYKSAPVQAQFMVNGFNPNTDGVAVKSGKAIIDVTAKAGDLYRRIQAEKPIVPDSFFDDVLYSKASICKNLKVSTDLSLQSGNNCP